MLVALVRSYHISGTKLRVNVIFSFFVPSKLKFAVFILEGKLQLFYYLTLKEDNGCTLAVVNTYSRQ